MKPVICKAHMSWPIYFVEILWNLRCVNPAVLSNVAAMELYGRIIEPNGGLSRAISDYLRVPSGND